MLVVVLTSAMALESLSEGDSIAVGVVLVAFGLIEALVGELGRRGRLPRQHWAGFRLPSTMSSDEAWQAAHMAGGLALVVAGVTAVAGGVALLAFRPEGGVAGALVTIVLLALLGGVIWGGWRAIRAARGAVMPYAGVVIEESLGDTSILQELKITSTRIEPVTERHRTPWLKQWTLHEVEIPDDQVDEVAERLSRALEPPNWHADFKNERYHYVVFPGEVFKIERRNPGEYEQVVAHGLSLGVPAHQLDFSPAIEQWERPDNS